jgi:hypothetical protein
MGIKSSLTCMNNITGISDFKTKSQKTDIMQWRYKYGL